MPEITIDGIKVYKPEFGLLGASIDVPTPGKVIDFFSFEVRGWALGSAGAVEEIEIRDSYECLATGKVSRRRPDVAASFPTAEHAAVAGFAVPVGIIGLPSSFKLDVVSVLPDGVRVPFAQISGRHRLDADRVPSEIRPIMVTTWGRMGTTWFLRILREHPEIVIHGSYPYETRAAGYWAHMLKILSEPAGTIEEFHEDRTKVRRHPVNALQPTEHYLYKWFGSEYTSELVHLSANSINRFYSSVAQAMGRTGARYFAEKVPPTHTPRVLWSLYPEAKELILVRDLRDVVCSIKAFNNRRGFRAFGEEHARNDAEFIRFLRSAAVRLLTAWRERSTYALLVRYEDLISYPVESLRQVLDYLELDDSQQVAERMLATARDASASMTEHVTASSPEASIGRWRRDLDPVLKELCEKAFDDILEEFDYGTSRAELSRTSA